MCPINPLTPITSLQPIVEFFKSQSRDSCYCKSLSFLITLSDTGLLFRSAGSDVSHSYNRKEDNGLFLCTLKIQLKLKKQHKKRIKSTFFPQCLVILQCLNWFCLLAALCVQYPQICVYNRGRNIQKGGGSINLQPVALCWLIKHHFTQSLSCTDGG